MARIYIPETFFGIRNPVQQYDIVSPRNLCNSLLHKFLIRIGLGEFCHILQISHGIPLAAWEFHPDICSQVFNEFITPDFVLIDYMANTVIEKNQGRVNMDGRMILG